MTLAKVRTVIISVVAYALLAGFALWVFARFAYSEEILNFYNSLEAMSPVYFNGVMTLACALFAFWSFSDIRTGKAEGTYEYYRVVLFAGCTLMFGNGLMVALSEAA